ncbi:gamma-glutamyltransferase family protein [Streptomyces sp. NPDC058280]|uniref:gamma-glutamyltransferase family protein n=1 Tax=Streptomyces sp. NPDC058280 TaxID=3346419 RepID=UPI0036E0BEBA
MSTGPAAEPGPRGGSLVYGDQGVVAAGSRQAADTAAAVLSAGGNAIDAAVAASATQCVVEFPWCGLGGDLFLMVDREDTGVVALNGSGAAPFRRGAALAGRDRLPRFGPLSVGVPGLPMAWSLALERFGSMPLAALLAPAIGLAGKGFALDHRTAAAVAAVAAAGDEEYPGLSSLLSGNGRRAGEVFTQPDLARSLDLLGRYGTDWFYRGEFAEKLAGQMRRTGGLLDAVDLAGHLTQWTEPLSVGYRGYRIYQHAPVSMGMLMLSELGLLEQFDLSGTEPGSVELVDLMVRCKVAAFSDLRNAQELTLPDIVERLSPTRAAWWRDRLAAGTEGDRIPLPGGNDTTCLAITDADGTTVTLIHSLFNTFGSREIVEGTGVVLNDRLAGLRLDGGPGPKFVPGGRPLHTLNTYMAKRDGRLVIAGATPGGRGQVQTNFQVLVNHLDFGMAPLAAVEQPRWLHGTPRRNVDDGMLHLEQGFPEQHADGLRRLGHPVAVAEFRDDDLFGSCTVVGTAPGAKPYAVADSRRGAAVSGC